MQEVRFGTVNDPLCAPRASCRFLTKAQFRTRKQVAKFALPEGWPCAGPSDPELAMWNRLFAAFICAVAAAGFAAGPDAAQAADLYVQEQSGTCQTVFTGMPTPPYFTRSGCIDNVITVHRLPWRGKRHVILHQRDVVVDPPLLVDADE